MRKSSDLPRNNIASAHAQSHGIHITVGTLQGFAASSLSLPTGILTAAFLSRILGPANYGALTVAASIVVCAGLECNPMASAKPIRQRNRNWAFPRLID